MRDFPHSLQGPVLEPALRQVAGIVEARETFIRCFPVAGMVTLSVTVEQLVHFLTFVPVALQVAAFVTMYVPGIWLSLAMVAVSTTVEQRVHFLTFIPVAVQVAFFVVV